MEKGQESLVPDLETCGPHANHNQSARCPPLHGECDSSVLLHRRQFVLGPHFLEHLLQWKCITVRMGLFITVIRTWRRGNGLLFSRLEDRKDLDTLVESTCLHWRTA